MAKSKAQKRTSHGENPRMPDVLTSMSDGGDQVRRL